MSRHLRERNLPSRLDLKLTLAIRELLYSKVSQTLRTFNLAIRGGSGSYVRRCERKEGLESLRI